MQTKKSRVSKIVHNVRQYPSANGMIYYHELTFDNGDKGQYGSKEDTCKKFTEGQEHEYTIEEKSNGAYKNYQIKPIQPQQHVGGFKGQPKDEGAIIAQSCLNYSTQFYQQRSAGTEDKIFELAERMHQWVIKHSSKNV